MSNYMMYNPYRHLTQAYQLTLAAWNAIKLQLSISEIADIENGGYAILGVCKIWKQG
jgi:hypothetical protein